MNEHARIELQKYFESVAPATFGDICLAVCHTDYHTTTNCKTYDMLQDPPVQDIIDMRHHIHCQKLCVVKGYYCQTVDNTTTGNSSIKKYNAC